MMSEVEEVEADGGDDVVAAYSQRPGTETKYQGSKNSNADRSEDSLNDSEVVA